MKILVIMGSPRKKDGARIIGRIEEKIQAYEKTIFEYVYLKKENIEDCRGCDQCFKKGEEYCPIKDDLKIICRKMDESEGVIFACPVYAHQITAPMKKFFDRLSYYFHRPKFFNKFSLVVATTASTGLKAVIDYLSLTAIGWGFNLIGKIGVISKQYFNDKEDFIPEYHEKINKKIDNAVSRIVQAKNGNLKKSPDLFSMGLFLAMREKAKKLKADTEHWQKNGWFNARYYYDVKFGFFKWLSYSILKNIIIPSMFKTNKAVIVQKNLH